MREVASDADFEAQGRGCTVAVERSDECMDASRTREAGLGRAITGRAVRPHGGFVVELRLTLAKGD